MKINCTIFIFLIILSSCSSATEKNEHSTHPEVSRTIESTESSNSSFGMESNHTPQGLAVGDRIPSITFRNASNDEILFEELYRNQPLVVIFYRGHWCPACNKHLSEFAERAVEIEESGAEIVAITPESYENADTTIAKTGIDFTVISDVDGSIMKSFDVQFDVTEEYQVKVEENYATSLIENSATQSAVLPVPATFIIDTTGTVVYRQFNPDYKERASMDEILNNLPE